MSEQKTHLSLESELRQAIYKTTISGLLSTHFSSVDKSCSWGWRHWLRWDHPEKGILTPNHFLDVAETSGLMSDIGDFVFFEACRQVSYWQHVFTYQDPFYLSVNLSPRQLQAPDLCQTGD